MQSEFFEIFWFSDLLDNLSFLVPKVVKLIPLKFGVTLLWPQRRPVSSERYRDRKKLDKNLSTFPDCEEILMYCSQIFLIMGATSTSHMVRQYQRAHVSRLLFEAKSAYWPFSSTEWSRVHSREKRSRYFKCTPPSTRDSHVSFLFVHKRVPSFRI